jgi:aryl-alcohol dehydrogenase-like predicted oxidoreductase
MLDTAPAYGDIEGGIGELARDHGFSICSKVSALPPACSEDEVSAFVDASIRRSQGRLGEQLGTILFHHAADLLGDYGEAAWAAALAAAARSNTRLGVSCYSPQEVAAVRTRFPISVAQLPGNVLDQRLVNTTNLGGVELHVRSVFLQGLLLLDTSEACKRVPHAAAALGSWETWRVERGLSRLQAALAIAKGLPGVRYCVVGVDRFSHLEEVAEAWLSADVLVAPELAILDQDVIDPRRWRAAGLEDPVGT